MATHVEDTVHRGLVADLALLATGRGRRRPRDVVTRPGARWERRGLVAGGLYHAVRHHVVVPVVLPAGVLAVLAGLQSGRGGAHQPQSLGVAVNVPEGPERNAGVDMHQDGGRPAVPGELHAPVTVDEEAELVPGVRGAGHVLTDDPVLRPVQQHVGVLGQLLPALQAGGVAAGETEGEGADVHVLRGQDLHHQPLARPHGLLGEDVAAAVLVVAPGGHTPPSVQTHVDSGHSVEAQRPELTAGVVSERHRHVVVLLAAVHREVVEGVGHVLHGVGLRAVLRTVLTVLTHVVLLLLQLEVAHKVVETPPHVHELHGGAVPVEVDHAPERLAGVEAAEEEALVGPIDPVVDVSPGSEVVVDQSVGLRVLLRQSLRPEPGLPREVGTGVLGQ